MWVMLLLLLHEFAPLGQRKVAVPLTVTSCVRDEGSSSLKASQELMSKLGCGPSQSATTLAPVLTKKYFT